MASLYDRLQDQLGDDDDKKTAGLSPLDLADLPENQRKVMFFLLRGARKKASDVDREHMEQKIRDMDQKTLDETLKELTHLGWLISFGEPPHERYRINFQHKRGSNLLVDVWNTLFELFDHLDNETDS